jgi:hypothetical protein
MGGDVPLVDVATLNVRWEVIYSAWKEMTNDDQGTGTTTRRENTNDTIDGCTTIGITALASADGKTYIKQNWDWLVPLEEKLFLAVRRRENGPDSLAMTEAGIVRGKLASTKRESDYVSMVSSVRRTGRTRSERPITFGFTEFLRRFGSTMESDRFWRTSGYVRPT